MFGGFFADEATAEQDYQTVQGPLLRPRHQALVPDGAA